MSDTTIATTILQQLGGKRFEAITGARHFLAIESGLRFHLPSRLAKDGINLVNVTLNDLDLYNVEFVRVGRTPSVKSIVLRGADPLPKSTVVRYLPSVHVEQLLGVFTETTGIYTSL